jgi:hypothetical protein
MLNDYRGITMFSTGRAGGSFCKQRATCVTIHNLNVTPALSCQSTLLRADGCSLFTGYLALVFLVTKPTSCSLLPTEFKNPTIRELLHLNSNPNGHGCLSACHGTLTILVTSVLNLARPASPPNPGNPTTDQRPYLQPRITSYQDPGGHCDLTTNAG